MGIPLRHLAPVRGERGHPSEASGADARDEGCAGAVWEAALAAARFPCSLCHIAFVSVPFFPEREK